MLHAKGAYVAPFVCAGGRTKWDSRRVFCPLSAAGNQSLTRDIACIQRRFQPRCHSLDRQLVPTTNCPIDAGSDRWSQS